MTVIKTDRLILRPWKEEDLEPFAALNADPRVMEYFPSTLSCEESNSMAKRMQAKIEERGWGFWAVSAPGIAKFIGFVGLNNVDKATFPAHFTPALRSSVVPMRAAPSAACSARGASDTACLAVPGSVAILSCGVHEMGQQEDLPTAPGTPMPPSDRAPAGGYPGVPAVRPRVPR